MSLTAYPLAHGSRENTACYGAGEPGALGFQRGILPCPQNGGIVVGLDWALPGSENGVGVTCFDYQKATNNTKPRPDAVKVLTVIDKNDGGKYSRWLVPDNYDESTFLAACCAGCDPVPAVAIPAPLIGWSECVIAPRTPNDCTFFGTIAVPAFTGTNDTYTVTPLGFNAAGQAIVFSPTTSTATSVAALATAMQTNWASELGTGVFTVNGQNIAFNSKNGAKVSFAIVQTDAP